MPLPEPGKDEKESDFISRCMHVAGNDPTFKTNEQAVAVCYSQWKKVRGEKKGTTLIISNFMQLRKISETERIIAGYASVPVVDAENDLITLDALRDAWAAFISGEYPILSLAHEDIPLGRILPSYTDKYGTIHKSGIDDRGLYVIAKFRADNKKSNECWNTIQSWGGRGAFSINASVIQEPKWLSSVDGSLYKQYGPGSIELQAIGVCQDGANPESTFSILKSKPTRKGILKLREPKILVVKN